MSVEKILDRLRREVDRLATEAEASVKEERAKVGPVLAAISEGHRGFKGMQSYPYIGWMGPKPGEGDWATPEKAEAWIKDMLDKGAAIHAGNEAAAKNNVALVAALIEYGKLLGLPEEQSYETGSGRSKKSHRACAKWIAGAHEIAPRDNEWSNWRNTLSNYERALGEWRQSIHRAQEEREAAERRRESERLRAEAERARIAEQVRQEITGKTPQQQRNEALAERIRAAVPESMPPAAPVFETPGQALEID